MMIEIRWHGRGGQGAKTAGQLLAEVAITAGKYGQGYPDFGPERMGAPMRAYTRISDEVIRLHTPITEPNIVLVLDETLLDQVNVTSGMPDDGILLVNTCLTPAEIRKKVKLVKGKIYCLDATGISLKHLKKNIPNTVIIGGLIKITGVLDRDGVITGIKHKFERKLSAQFIEANILALKDAYEEVISE
jgi:pyruvate ferredoxin oxidoreductase gamma subunit